LFNHFDAYRFFFSGKNAIANNLSVISVQKRPRKDEINRVIVDFPVIFPKFLMDKGFILHYRKFTQLHHLPPYFFGIIGNLLKLSYTQDDFDLLAVQKKGANSTEYVHILLVGKYFLIIAPKVSR
jgi:hypothetical protein